MLSCTIAYLALATLPAPKEWTIEVGGVRREATVYLPEGKGPHPVVFAFHGHGGNRRNAARTFQIHELWPEAITVYMQGIPIAGRTDPQGVRNGWQKNPGEVGDRDLKFFDMVYDRVIRESSGDPKRVFACGHSNGGRFTYLLWSERGDKFAAFGPSASPGTMLTRRMQAKPAFVIAGEKDQLVSFASQQLTIDAIKRLNGVSADAAKKDGYLSIFKGDKAELRTYVYPGDHTYPRAANPMLVDFFKSVGK